MCLVPNLMCEILIQGTVLLKLCSSWVTNPPPSQISMIGNGDFKQKILILSILLWSVGKHYVVPKTTLWHKNNKISFKIIISSFCLVMWCLMSLQYLLTRLKCGVKKFKREKNWIFVCFVDRYFIFLLPDPSTWCRCLRVVWRHFIATAEWPRALPR